MLTVNVVLQFIQHRQVAAIASMPGIQGQMIDYIAGRGSRIPRNRIKQVRFPQGAVIGAILRKDKLIIPDGATVVEIGDRAVVFTLPEARWPTWTACSAPAVELDQPCTYAASCISKVCCCSSVVPSC